MAESAVSWNAVNVLRLPDLAAGDPAPGGGGPGDPAGAGYTSGCGGTASAFTFSGFTSQGFKLEQLPGFGDLTNADRPI
jgi:hypothetical protein